MFRRTTALCTALIVATTLAPACSSEKTPARTCTGGSAPCICPDGRQGMADCDATGATGTCVCAEVDAGSPPADATAPDAAKPRATLSVLAIQFELHDSAGYAYHALNETLVDAFRTATGGRLALKMGESHALAMPPQSPTHNYTDTLVEHPTVADEDAARVWYYYKGLDQLMRDLGQAIATAGIDIDSYDLVLVLTDAQVEGFGVSPRVKAGPGIVVLETTTVSGWDSGPDYYRKKNTHFKLVDLALHEIGHFMGLDHACDSCFARDPSERDPTCCDGCTWQDDVMSYCRIRPVEEDERFYNVFGKCTLAQIEDKFIPNFTAGLPTEVQPPCE